MKIQFITSDLLNILSHEADISPRKRKNYNFHLNETEACHRLLNAIQPGTYVPPHCHDDKDETMIMVRGKMGIIFFEESGAITEARVLMPNSDCMGVNIARGIFHSIVALEPFTVFFESKEGPYRALHPQECASFAPKADNPAAKHYLNTLITVCEKLL